ncbi:MAG: PilZ domain-containing protein [Thermoanaerobaculales bacterium]
MATPKSILSVGLDSETFLRIAPILQRNTLSVEVAGQASHAAELANRRRFDLVVCRYPLPDMKLREFVAAIRRNGSASRRASLLLLTIPEMQTEARFGVSGGPYLVFSQQEPLGRLDQGAAHLLQVAPRCAPRITTRLRVNLENGSETFEGWIVNLSSTGMLVGEAPILEVGSRCSFEFHLPRGGGMTAGSAEVVRHAIAKREGSSGFAVRFSGFEPGCRETLEDWCETKVGAEELEY